MEVKSNTVVEEAIGAAAERDRIAPRDYVVAGFQYIRKNIQKKAVVFYCCHRRRNECKAELRFKIDPFTKAIDCAKFEISGLRTRHCCITAGHDPNEYHWDGKPDIGPIILPQDPLSSLSKRTSSTTESGDKMLDRIDINKNEIENDENKVPNLPRLSESPSKLPRHNAFDVKEELTILVRSYFFENF